MELVVVGWVVGAPGLALHAVVDFALCKVPYPCPGECQSPHSDFHHSPFHYLDWYIVRERPLNTEFGLLSPCLCRTYLFQNPCLCQKAEG